MFEIRTGLPFRTYSQREKPVLERSANRMAVLDPSRAKEALGRAGVNESDSLLVYGDSGEGAAFVFWALSYLGHKDVSLIDGGRDAARDAGVALTTNAPSPTPTNYTTHIVPWLLVTPEDLEGMLAEADIGIVDARDFSEYGRNRINRSLSLSPDKIYDDSMIKDAGTLEESVWAAPG